MDDLLQEFIAETRETLEAISGEIVAWEADPSDRARLDSIFRFVHTIKGSCGFLDLPRLARLSHAAEDALAAVRAGERVADAALVTAILAIIDRIAEIVEAIDAGAALDDSGEDLLLGALAVAPLASSPTIVPIDVGAPSAAGAPVQPRRSVRLSVDLLDRMMGGVSDMVLARNQLSRRLRDLGDPSLDAVLERLSMTVAELRDTVTRTRMQRIDALFSALPRIVRDTAGTLGKQVALTIEGAEVELDREMIELLRDPLVHMVRNAIDHGIEAPSARLLAGKPVKGTLCVSARQAGNLIVVEIADDGAGIDADALVGKLSRSDPTRAPALATLDADARARLIFEPGLSSRDEVTSLSGRGVGMDVVRANVEQIGGRIALRNRPGRGLVVVLEVPLTLAILNTVLVEAAGTRFALPQQAVEEIVAFDPAVTRIDRIGGGAIVTMRGRRLPLADIAAIVDADGGRAPRFVAILNLRDGAFALALDGVADTQELVVRPAAPAVMSAGLYAGQVLPDDGLPVLLLDCAGIAERAQLRFATRREAAAVAADAPPPARALLFRDADDVVRGIRVEAVERIEAIGPGALSSAAGAWWLIEGGRPVRVHAAGTLDPAAITAVLRLGAAAGGLAYPVRDVLDLVALPADLAGGEHGGAAVAVIDGATIEIVAPAAPAVDARPICLLSGSDGAWMESFLKPTIEGAGYRAARSLAIGERAAAVLAMEDDAPATGAIRLSRQEGDGLYRLDRAAIAAELTELAKPIGRRA